MVSGLAGPPHEWILAQVLRIPRIWAGALSPLPRSPPGFQQLGTEVHYGCDVAERAESSLAEALLAAPCGVALLARLEAEQRNDVSWYGDCPSDTDADAVARATHAVQSMTLGTLLSWAVDSAESLAGPWTGDSPKSLALAYELAPQRRPIADAIVERFGARLGQRVDLNRQQVWLSESASDDHAARLGFQDFSEVYGNGEFPWDGLWTVTDVMKERNAALA